MFGEITFAVRRLRQTPGSASLSVATLAFGLGLAAGLGALLNAVVLRPLPIAEPERLVAVSRVNREGQVRWMPLSTMDALARESPVFTGLCGYAAGGLFTTEPGGSPLQSPFEFVTARCYELAGVRPFLGRLISEREAPSAGEPQRVAVLGHGYWRRRFGEDPGVIGRTLRVENLALTIIGVTPPGFSGLQVDVAPDVTVPATLLPALGLGRPGAVQVNYVVARLRSGVGIEQARARLSAAWPALQAETMPAGLTPAQQSEFRSFAGRLEPAGRGFSNLRRTYAQPLWLVTGLAVILLALTAANLSGFLLARTDAREQELAVRAAMGASRSQLVRLLLADSLVLALTATILALPIAWSTAAWMGRLIWTGLIPPTISLTPDRRVFLSTAAAGLVVAVVMTVAPAWPIIRGRSAPTFRSGSESRTYAGRMGKTLLVLQLAASLVLVFGAGLFVRSSLQLNANPVGASLDGLMLARLAKQSRAGDQAPGASYYAEMLARIGALPGVRSASLSRLFPAIGNEADLLTPAADADLPGPRACRAVVDVVAPSFFDTAGIPLTGGRDFTWQDDGERPKVAIVNQAAARVLFGNHDPIGRRIRIGSDPELQSVEVVALVADAMIGNVRSPHVPVIVRPALQDLRFARYSAILVRTDPASRLPAEAIMQSVRSLGFDYVSSIRSARDQLRASVAKDEVLTALSLLFGAGAGAIALVGVFGTLALDVSRRRREIGVRMALGASSAQVTRTIVARLCRLAAGGLIVGIPSALAASRLVGSLLYGITPSDLPSLAGAAIVVLAIALAGAAVPAVRAAGIDPAVTMKSE